MTTPPPTNDRGKYATDLSPSLAQSAAVKPVQRRLLVPLAITMLILVGGFDALLLDVYHDGQNQASQLLLKRAAIELEESLAEQTGSLAAIESAIIRDKALSTALKSQDRDALLELI